MVVDALEIEIIGKTNKESETQKEKEGLFQSYSTLFNYVKQIILFQDKKYSIKKLIELYIIMKVINLFNDKLLLLIIMNIIIFYAVLENYSDHFLFKAKMSVKQVFEGIIGVIECIIPRYEEFKFKYN